MTRTHDWHDELLPEAYKILVEGVPAILYIDRPDELSTNLYTSPQIEQVLGFTVGEWTSDPELWRTQLHPDDRERALATHRLSNTTGSTYVDEYRILTKDGRVRWFRDEASPVLADDGQVLYWRGVMLDITERKEAEDKLRWSLEVLRRTLQQRRELAQRLQSAQEAERRRIAADIHDDPIQVMAAVDMRLQMLQATPETVTSEVLADIEHEVAAAIDRLRSMLFELRPMALDRDGLVAALRLYLEHSAKNTGWAVEVHDHLDAEPDPGVSALLYRVAQEAVMNARKHAEATRVEIDVATAAEGVMVRIRDDGMGFVPDLHSAPTPGHMGVSTMVERTELAGGWTRITSAPGAGTTVECWLPRDTLGADVSFEELRSDPS
jgi:PAS domain S-box-containing protein